MTHPPEASLKELTEAVRLAVIAADPLMGALSGGELELPKPDLDIEAAALARLDALSIAIDELGEQADVEDELDRLGLLYGLRRAIVNARLVNPEGPLLVERHLQLRLVRLVDGAVDALESLAQFVDSAPGLLLGARRDPAAGNRAAGQIALDSTRRIPALLDACAGAAREAPGVWRTRVEAGLGPLLQASAEESGWLLKTYLPAAPATVAPHEFDPIWTGLGMSLDDLEAAAEAALAEAVADLSEHPPAAEPDVPGERSEAVEVEAAWAAAAVEAKSRWGELPAAESRVHSAPSWMLPLVPPLSVVPGGRAGGPVLVLAAPPMRGALSAIVREVFEADFLLVAAQRRAARPARQVLPAAELQQGWRAQVRAAGAGQAPWAPELAWRAALALAGIAMLRGHATVEGAAGLIAAEAGLPEDQALLQAATVANRPLAALSWLAGRAAVAGAMRTRTAAELLAAGPLPAVALGRA